MTYDDSYIERWGEVFTSQPWIRSLCTFEVFLRDPYWYVGSTDRPQYNCRCLLLAQRAVQLRLDNTRRAT